MAWDSKSARRRGNSNAAAARLTSIDTPKVQITPKSTHVSDPALQPFLSSTFDPAEYLNSTLPSLSTGTTSNNASSHEVTLAELSTETQTVLSQLSAHTSRLTSTLTQLTDEILRSGSRLAYEVEILRGETLGLSEALTEGLDDEISKFVPGGVAGQLARRSSRAGDVSRRRSSTLPVKPVEEPADTPQQDDPPYIRQLRTLTLVRARLDTVIKTFGDAMSWTFPPSEVSVTSSFVSVSAPEPGSEAHSVEEKGQQISKNMRNEIADLLLSTQDPVDGVEAATKRVEELKELAKVWKGTAEEKARGRFVESLAKLVEDRTRELLRESETNGRRAERSRQDVKSPDNTEKAQGGYGFMSQLQKMRGGT